jgi:hypothetical protein
VFGPWILSFDHQKQQAKQHQQYQSFQQEVNMENAKFKLVGLMLLMVLTDIWIYNEGVCWLLNQPNNFAIALGLVSLYAMAWISYKITTKVIEKW